MKAKFSQLVSYFESLATQHKSIGHSSSNKHFFRLELEEFLTGMKAKIHYPALILEGYDFNFVDNRSDNVHKEIHTAFLLVDKVADKGDYDRIHQVWDCLEEIGDEILIRILRDKRDQRSEVLSHFNMTSVSGSPITDMNLVHYGIRYDFKLSWPLVNDIDPEVWNG